MRRRSTGVTGHCTAICCCSFCGRFPLEMDSLIFPHLRSTFLAAVVTECPIRRYGGCNQDGRTYEMRETSWFEHDRTVGCFGESSICWRKHARSGREEGFRWRFMSICDFRRIFPMAVTLRVLCHVYMWRGRRIRGGRRPGRARAESLVLLYVCCSYTDCKSVIFPPKAKTSAAIQRTDPVVLVYIRGV